MEARLDPQRVSFDVRGKPQPAGSKRAFPIRRKEGGIGVAVTDDNPRAKGWQAEVAYAGVVAMEAIGVTLPWEDPLGLAVIFTLRRPKGHFGTGRNARNLKPTAALWPTVKPDASKLVRAIEDALTGVVWTDDARVVEQLVTKRYGEPEGAHVEVWKL
jgi:Holliday junction resolvase RusA-like endonuclease